MKDKRVIGLSVASLLLLTLYFIEVTRPARQVQATPTPDAVSRMEIVSGSVPDDVALAFEVAPSQMARPAEINPACSSGLYAIVVSGTDLILQCAVSEPEPTPSPSPTAVPPTPTAVPPTPTAVPPVGIAPYPGAPACPTHDDTQKHGLWDEDRGCHYDHEHGLPAEEWVWELFGDFTQYTDGRTIGYIWETPNENRDKHPGYNWGGFDVRGLGCRPFLPNTAGVNAWYIQAHGMANSMGQQARNHSFLGMASLCNQDGPAGTIIVGGHQDFGQLVSPYKGGDGAILGLDVYAKAPQPSYHNETPPYVGLARNRASVETWNSAVRANSAPFVNENQIFRFAFRIQDPVGAWLPDNTFMDLGGNSSARQFYQVEVTIPGELAGVDGRVNYDGFVDVYGNLDAGCTAASSTCAPLVIRDALPGEYTVNLRDYGADLFGGRFIITQDGYYEGDILFDGESAGWIGPMN